MQRVLLHDAKKLCNGVHKGQYRLNKEKGGSMMQRDGRPQGPTYTCPPDRISASPLYLSPRQDSLAPTILRSPLLRVSDGPLWPPVLFMRYCPQGGSPHRRGLKRFLAACGGERGEGET